MSIERRLGKPPVLDPRLDDVVAAAEECGLELHLGLYNVGRGWMPLPDQKFIYQVCREELVVARDLAERYGQSPALNGWYISPEIFYLYHGLLRRLDMRAFLEPICRDLKSATPRARIGISPGTYARKSHHERIKQFWLETLRDTGVDLIYPQDTVGNQFVEVDQAESVWQLWEEIAEALQIELWANCEAFTRINYSSRGGLPLRRCVRLLQVAAACSLAACLQNYHLGSALLLQRAGSRRRESPAKRLPPLL